MRKWASFARSMLEKIELSGEGLMFQLQNELADALYDLGDIDKSIEYFGELLDLYKTKHGRKGSVLVSLEKNLGLAFSANKMPKLATTHFKKALDAAEIENNGILGFIDTTEHLCNLAKGYKQQEKFSKSEGLLSIRISDLEKLLDTEESYFIISKIHLALAKCYIGFADLYGSQNQSSEELFFLAVKR